MFKWKMYQTMTKRRLSRWSNGTKKKKIVAFLEKYMKHKVTLNQKWDAIKKSEETYPEITER